MINIIVVTHGDFGAYLIEAAEEIVGPQDCGVRCVSISARLSIDEVRERLSSAVADLETADGVVVAVDMPGGTPGNVAMPLARSRCKIGVVSGVNLYMLVTAFNYRSGATLEELVERMVAAGKKSISDMKSMFLARRA